MRADLPDYGAHTCTVSPPYLWYFEMLLLPKQGISQDFGDLLYLSIGKFRFGGIL